MNKIRAIAAAAGLVVAGFANAGLNRVGPTNLPSPAGHGFPTWYQDNNGMVLDLCLPDLADAGNAQALACFLPFNPPATGFVFPKLFPDEMFYFNAGSSIATGGWEKCPARDRAGRRIRQCGTRGERPDGVRPCSYRCGRAVSRHLHGAAPVWCEHSRR